MLGFVGCGNMAQAMLKGILSKGLYKKEEIIVSRRSESALADIQKEYGVTVTTDNAEVAKKADIIILAVKPIQFPTVIGEIRKEVTEEKLVISIAAGQTIRFDDASYTITAVGSEAPVTLAGLGHCTMNFSGQTTVELPGTIYIENKPLPEIKVGTVIQILAD